jgi:hypothetical protein
MTEPSTPPQRRRRDASLSAIIVGLVFLGIGIWYFLDTTLGLTMPDISWDALWPILLIGLGGLILFRAAADRRT